MTKQNQDELVAIFDIDETLLQSGRKLKYDVINAMARLGINITPEQITSDWYKLAESYGISREDFDKAFDKRKSWEQSLRDKEAPLYQDTIPCLEALKQRGVRLAALSKSIPEHTNAKLKYHNLDAYFSDTENVHPKNPDKRDGALNLIKRLGPETISRAYFIGDKPEDVVVAEDTAREYSLSTGGIYLNRNSKSVPKEVTGYHSINSLEEIPRIIGA